MAALLFPPRTGPSLAGTERGMRMDREQTQNGTKAKAGASRAAYLGDATLEKLLAAAGSSYDLAGLTALVEGVNAAPPAADWTRLVAPAVSPSLAEQLEAFRDE